MTHSVLVSKNGSTDAWRLALGLAVALFIASLQITDHYPPWTAFHSEVLAALAFFGFSLWAWPRLRPVASPPSASWVLWAVAAVPWLQWSMGTLPVVEHAVLPSLYLWAAGHVLWTSAALAERDRERLGRALMFAIVVGGVFNGLVAVYQWLGLRGVSQLLVIEGAAGDRAGGNVAQSNHAATLMLMAVLGLIDWRSRRVVPGALLLVAGVVLCVGLALTQSRVPWLAVVLLAVWVAIRRGGPLASWRAGGTVVIAAALALYLLAFWGAVHLPESFAPDLHRDPDGSRASVGRRPVLWAQWWTGLQSSPLLGFGWRQGTLAQQVGALVHPGVESSPYAHNLLLDLLAWNGWVLGSALVLVLIVWFIRFGWRVQGHHRTICFAALVVLLAHALVEYPFAYTYLLLPAAYFAGVMVAEGNAPGRGTRWSPVWLASAALAAAGLTAIVRDYMLVEPNIRLLREQNARIGGQWHSPPAENLWVLDALQAFSRDARIVPRADMPDHELASLRTTSKLFPTLGLLQTRALALAASGRDQEAAEALQLVCVLHGDRHYGLVLERAQRLASESMPAAAAFADDAKRRWDEVSRQRAEQGRCLVALPRHR